MQQQSTTTGISHEGELYGKSLGADNCAVRPGVRGSRRNRGEMLTYKPQASKYPAPSILVVVTSSTWCSNGSLLILLAPSCKQDGAGSPNTTRARRPESQHVWLLEDQKSRRMYQEGLKGREGHVFQVLDPGSNAELVWVAKDRGHEA